MVDILTPLWHSKYLEITMKDRMLSFLESTSTTKIKQGDRGSH